MRQSIIAAQSLELVDTHFLIKLWTSFRIVIYVYCSLERCNKCNMILWNVIRTFHIFFLITIFYDVHAFFCVNLNIMLKSSIDEKKSFKNVYNHLFSSIFTSCMKDDYRIHSNNKVKLIFFPNIYPDLNTSNNAHDKM